MYKGKTVCIVVPAFNEAGVIGSILDKLQTLAKAHNWEILVVDDGSTDDTAKIAQRYNARVISHEKNRGYGASLKTATLAVDTDVIVFVDSDGQHNPDEITLLLDQIENYDMVVGARTSQSHTDIGRRPGKKVLRVFADFLAREKIPDVNSGFRAFNRNILLDYLHLMPDGFSFSTTSTFAMLKGDHKIKWVPITTAKRTGKSTVKQLKHGTETMMLMLRLTVLFDPLRIFLPVSGILALFAMVMTILNFIFYRMAIPTSAVLLGITAVIVFMLGLLTDQVAAIRRDLYKRF